MLIRKQSFLHFIFAVFLVATALGVSQHEMWRDEVQAWLISRASHSVPELLQNLKYEGHPPLWHLLLYGLQSLQLPIQSMAWMHYAFSVIGVWLLIYRSHFTFIEKTLFLASGIFLFEYTLVARNYAPAVTLIFILISWRKFFHDHPVVQTVFLLLLANFNIFALVFACGYFFIDVWSKERAQKQASALLVATLIFLGGLWLTYEQLKPPGDLGVHGSWYLSWNDGLFQDRMQFVLRSLSGQPQFRFESIWNWLSLLVLLSLLPFVQHRKVGLAWLLILLCYLGFFYTRYSGQYRHHIMLVICWASLLWYAYETNPSAWLRFSSFVPLTLVLFWQSQLGIKWLREDLKRPFSNSLAAAQFLKHSTWTNDPVIAFNDWGTSPILGYWDKEFYYPQTEALGTFVKWNTQRKDFNSDELWRRIQSQLAKTPARHVLILNIPTPVPQFDGIRVSPLAQFTGAMMWEENFFIYTLEPVP